MDLKEANENLLYRSSRPWAVFEMALANIDAASPKAAPPEVSRGEWLALALRFAGKTHYRRQLELVSDLVRTAEDAYLTEVAGVGLDTWREEGKLLRHVCRTFGERAPLPEEFEGEDGDAERTLKDIEHGAGELLVPLTDSAAEALLCIILADLADAWGAQLAGANASFWLERARHAAERAGADGRPASALRLAQACIRFSERLSGTDVLGGRTRAEWLAYAFHVERWDFLKVRHALRIADYCEENHCTIEGRDALSWAGLALDLCPGADQASRLARRIAEKTR